MGKKADFFLFDPAKSVKSCPVHDIVATLIYSGDHKAVDTVVINGKTVMEEGRYLLADEQEILNTAPAHGRGSGKVHTGESVEAGTISAGTISAGTISAETITEYR